MVDFLFTRYGLFQKKRACLFFVLWALQTTIGHSAPTLSSKAQVSLITISPGSDLYSTFGHSTLWVLDVENGIDRVYNYGTFDFNQPNFYMNFVRGHLDYTLSVYTFEDQYMMAQYEGRGLSQQILNLDSIQKQKVYDFLEWNALPANAHYLYDFYLDNCSSRLRDVLKNGCGNALEYDRKTATPYSFREWMNLFLVPHPWSALGMNIGLGAPADKKTDYLTQMYLPINLKLGFSSATVAGKPLVNAENELLYAVAQEPKSGSGNILATTISILVFALFFTFFQGKYRLLSLMFDFSLIVLVSLLGITLALLWFATDHWVCAWNTDLLWANPLCLGYFLLFTRWKSSQGVYYLCIATLVLSFCYFTLAYFFPEKPILSLFPLILALQVRIVYRLYHARKQRISA